MDHEDEIAAMPGTAFRSWVRTLPEDERESWRRERRWLRRARYESKRLELLARPRRDIPGVAEAVELTKSMAPRQTRKFVAALPEEMRIEVRRELKRVAWRRWYARHPDECRAKAKAEFEALKTDPEKYAAYLERRREQMRARRHREREAQA